MSRSPSNLTLYRSYVTSAILRAHGRGQARLRVLADRRGLGQACVDRGPHAGAYIRLHRRRRQDSVHQCWENEDQLPHEVSAVLCLRLQLG